MTVYGHQFVRAALERSLPPVTLLKGPPSIGKRTLAQHVVVHHGGQKFDWKMVDHLSVEASRDLHSFFARAPLGSLKFGVVRLDKASEGALHTLLKLLEEPPSWARIFLLSSHRVLDTVVSRAQVFPLGLLGAEDMAKVLEKVGVPADQIPDLVTLSRGQVSPLLEIDSVSESRNKVLSVLKAVQEADPELLSRAAQTWDDAAHSLLRRWCAEAATDRWALFRASETAALLAQDPNVPMRVLLALRTESRAKLALRVGLTPLIRERQEKRKR